MNPTNQTSNQLSPELMRNLCSSPVLINGSAELLLKFRSELNHILELGETEHSGDWDPYLRITFADSSEKESITGYTEIHLANHSNQPLDKDFQVNPLSDDFEFTNPAEELTYVAFYTEELGEQAIPIYYPISSIISIQVIE